jgi:hypothetical protein
MVVLYPYPELFGVADNNGYGAGTPHGRDIRIFATVEVYPQRARAASCFLASAGQRREGERT